MGRKNLKDSILYAGGGVKSSKKFWPVLFVFIAFLVVDILINFLSENTNAENISSPPWIALFVTLTGIFGAGQFFLLGFLKENIKDIGMKNELLYKSYYVVTIIQYLLFAILLATTLQVVLTSHYSTFLLTVSNTMSLGLAAALFAILGWLFFSWSRTNKNFVVLLYGLSSVAIIVNMILTIIFYDVALFKLDPTRTSQSEVKFPIFDPNSAIGIIQGLQGLTAFIYFDLLWVSTAFLLRHYSRRIGKIKFWGIMTTPLALFTIQFLLVFPYFALNPQQNIIYVILGFSFPGIVSGVLFAIPFLTISRATRPAAVSKYLLISAIGIVLFQFSTLAAVVYAPYPPFGLYSVSATGLSSLFVLVGVYSSAISTAQDSAIREKIRRAIVQEAEMLGSIGAAEKEQYLAKKVMAIVKNNVDRLYEETGVEPSLKDEEMKSYLDLVMIEIGKSGVISRPSREEKGGAKDDSVKRRDTEVE